MLKITARQIVAGMGTGLLAGLLIVAFESDFEGQICEYKQATKHEDCSTYSLFSFLFIQINKTLNDYGAEITGLATVLLAIITGLLVSVARGQFKTMRAQLRAYIAVSPVGIKLNGPKYGMTITVRNTGQTPAKNVRLPSATSCLLPYPLDPSFLFPILNKSPNVFSIGAGTEQSMIAWGPQPLSVNEIKRMKTPGGAQKLYAYGTVTYEDVFGNAWYTNFCFWTEVLKDGESFIIWVSEHHNDST
jgi:hypothetical protein